MSKFLNLVAATHLADRLRIPDNGIGLRVFGDQHEAGFFVETDAGLAMVKLELMQCEDADVKRASDRWESKDGGHVVSRKKRRPIYDSEGY